MIESCKRCGGGLDFAGWDKLGQRVLICLNSLFYKKNDGTQDSMSCNVTGDYVIQGASFKTVNWWSRKD